MKVLDKINDLRTLRADLQELKKLPKLFAKEIRECEEEIRRRERVRTYWVVDADRQQRFGPFTNQKAAKKIRTEVRVISDMFLEIGTNVGIVREDEELEFAGVAAWPIGDMDVVRQQNNNLRGERCN